MKLLTYLGYIPFKIVAYVCDQIWIMVYTWHLWHWESKNSHTLRWPEGFKCDECRDVRKEHSVCSVCRM